MSKYVTTLLSAPLPNGAEIHPYYPAFAQAGYIDDTFALPTGGYEQPYPITEEEARMLVAHGAKDRR